MKYFASYHTDVGITKKTNQDSFAIKIVEINREVVAFAVVCDGMGGLEKGELASKEVVYAFCDWFENVLYEDIANRRFEPERLKGQWSEIINQQNVKLGKYGKENNFMLGTTVTAILMYKEKYYITHVGDSRVYQLTDTVNILTTDHTLVAREVAAGRLTPRQALVDPRRSILLQCVGASEVVKPEFLTGKVKKDTTYMICSDGFRHKISESEILENLGQRLSINESVMHRACVNLVETVKKRKENDNVTVVLIKAV